MLGMAADAAGGDTGVFRRHAAEGEHDVCIGDDLVPADVAPRHVVIAAENVRQDDRGSAGAVTVDGADIAAERGVEKAMQLALGVMESSGAGPAIGPAEHRMGPMRLVDAAQFRSDAVERLTGEG